MEKHIIVAVKVYGAFILKRTNIVWFSTQNMINFVDHHKFVIEGQNRPPASLSRKLINRNLSRFYYISSRKLRNDHLLTCPGQITSELAAKISFCLIYSSNLVNSLFFLAFFILSPKLVMFLDFFTWIFAISNLHNSSS